MDKSLERDVPYPFEKVWDAALWILRQPEWDLVRADKGTGGLEVKVVMDLLTWTETFYLNVTRIDENNTRVLMGRIGLSQPLDWGLATQYIDSFLQQARDHPTRRKLDPMTWAFASGRMDHLVPS
ncbi:hypothetical protein E6H21_09885 [Candidatus Bathyarchaeota archaeon]|nr:MAG: hypothetical protein E6H21_09885 [Candidatus Bathyarchaeota archaeon]